MLAILALGWALVGMADPKDQAPEAAALDDVTVKVTAASEQNFPDITVQFEVERPDGSFLLDARREDFRVTEDGRAMSITSFQAPEETQSLPTTVVLVVDRSRSMIEEDRIGGLKRAVATFLEDLPPGSRIAVIAFGSQVSLSVPSPRTCRGPEGRQQFEAVRSDAVFRRRGRRARIAER